MKIKIGLCGLPNSGKSTFIKLVSQVEVLIAPYPFTTLKAQEYAVPIFSNELKLLHSITQTKEVVPPYLFFVDVPGLIRGAHKGEGLGNEFLSYLRGCDVILEIVRNFKKEDVPHPEGEINPLRDIKIIEEEVFLADKEIIDRAIKKLEKEKSKETKEKIKALEIIKNNFNKRWQEYNELLKEFNLLLTKKWFLLINGEEHGQDTEKLYGQEYGHNTDRTDRKYEQIHIQDTDEIDRNLMSEPSVLSLFKSVYNLDLAWEIELIENKIQENEFKPKVFEFLNQFRKDLDLIQFFTFNQDITQGWLIKKNSSIIEAASLIHTDFGVKFKIAETIFLDDFVKIYQMWINTDKDKTRINANYYWEEAKKLGIIKNKGRDAKIEENEIILVKI